MRKSLIVLAILSTTGAPALAQTAPPTTPQNVVQPTKPVMVKKRVCEVHEDDNPYSRLGSRKICHMVEVPAATTPQPGQPQPQASIQGK